jgi:hypothetical protein
MLIEINKAKIVVTSTVPLLRLNKLAGMLTTGNIDLTEPSTIAEFGRGKSISIAPCLITTGLHGTVGKIEDTDFTHVSGVVIKSEVPTKLPTGLLIQFVIYGYELERINEHQQEVEMAIDLGMQPELKVMNIAFDRTVKTKSGSNIKPPTITFTAPDKDMKSLVEGANDLFSVHPELAVSPTQYFPGLAHWNQSSTFSEAPLDPALAPSEA